MLHASLYVSMAAGVFKPLYQAGWRSSVTGLRTSAVVYVLAQVIGAALRRITQVPG